MQKEMILIFLCTFLLLSCTQPVAQDQRADSSIAQEGAPPSNQEPVKKLQAELQRAFDASGEISLETYADVEQRIDNLEKQGYETQNLRDLLAQFQVGGTKVSSSQKIEQPREDTQNCDGSGSVTFTSPPMRLEDIASIQSIGLMIGGHVTPIDHGYYTAKGWKPGDGRENLSIFVEVLAPADGIITELGSMPAEFASSSVGDYRFEIQHTCTFKTIYIHVNQLSEKLQKAVGKREPLVVKAGEVIGKAPGFDFSVHDEEVTLPGFIVPEHYEVEPWKIHTVDMFAPFVEPLRSELLAKNVRQKEPRAGKIDYDIDGKLVGNWFEENTNGYRGKEKYQRLTGYWTTHLAFAYEGLDPSLVIVSLGNFSGEAQQFAVKGNAPDPATVDETDGLVKYELVKYEYLTDEGNFWDRTGFAKVVEAKGMEEVQGTVLVQMLEKRKIKFEVFPGKSASQVEGFTGKEKVYER